jgi:hypothetical protein
MLKRAKKWAKQYGKTLDDVLLSIIYDETQRTGDRIAGIKLFKEYTMARVSEDGATDRALGPALFLPEQRPQLGIVPGGKSA